MVYIKLTPEAWTLSGLQKYIAEASIIKINEIRYVSYPDFSKWIIMQKMQHNSSISLYIVWCLAHILSAILK